MVLIQFSTAILLIWFFVHICPMEIFDLLRLRLANQKISDHQFLKPRDVVAWMGAMQAQEYGMARWAIGVRLAAPDIQIIQRAIDKGDIIRTHLLRPTWHLVSARDVRWMLDLTAPHIQASVKSRFKELELTPATLNKGLRVLEKLLQDGDHLTRDALIAQLEKSKVAMHNQRASHLLLWAELEKVICNGALKDGKNTYAHFDLRVKDQKPIDREEALKNLAMRYFASRGPATVFDFANWSGLPMADVKLAVAFNEKKLLSEKIDSKVYWYGSDQIPAVEEKVYFLPAFDEFVIGYKDRSACLPAHHKPTVISINGLFFPTLVFRGKIMGLWKKAATSKGVKVIPDLFTDSPVSRKFASMVNKGMRDTEAFFRGWQAAKP